MVRASDDELARVSTAEGKVKLEDGQVTLNRAGIDDAAHVRRGSVMDGFVTTRHLFTHSATIVKEFGTLCLLRCLWRTVTADHAVTFLECTVPIHGSAPHFPVHRPPARAACSCQAPVKRNGASDGSLVRGAGHGDHDEQSPRGTTDARCPGLTPTRPMHAGALRMEDGP